MQVTTEKLLICLCLISVHSQLLRLALNLFGLDFALQFYSLLLLFIFLYRRCPSVLL